MTDALSEEALNQINEKGYDTEMRANKISNILKLGITLSGKNVKIIGSGERRM